MSKIEVIPKVWGEEVIVVNKDYCGKVLRIKPGFRTSLHYHTVKDEVFYVSMGHLLLEAAALPGLSQPLERLVLLPRAVHPIVPGTVHRLWGLTGVELIEFSTHSEDSDSIRIEVGGPFSMTNDFPGLEGYSDVSRTIELANEDARELGLEFVKEQVKRKTHIKQMLDALEKQAMLCRNPPKHP